MQNSKRKTRLISRQMITTIKEKSKKEP